LLAGAVEQKNSGGELKGSQGETCIRVEGGVLLEGANPRKSVIGL